MLYWKSGVFEGGRTHRSAPTKTLWVVLTLALLLGAAWYCRPVDIYGLGMDELEAITVSVQHNEPGQGVDIVWSAGALPGDSQWQSVLEELESLRFHRSLGNLIREYYQSGSIKTELADQISANFHLIDRTGRYMILQIGACHSCYTSLHTGSNLPMSLSGGEDAAQALTRRLQEL